MSERQYLMLGALIGLVIAAVCVGVALWVGPGLVTGGEPGVPGGTP